MPSSGGLFGRYDDDIRERFCVLSDNCNIYRKVRPISLGVGYRSVHIAAGYGDPYFYTWDFFHYTFSAIGEFWLIMHSDFNVQLRMIQATDIDGNLVQGTIFDGVAVEAKDSSSVCVLVADDRAGLKLFVDHSTDNENWFQVATDGDVLELSTVTIQRQGGKLQVQYTSGVGFIASTSYGQLILNVIASDSLKNAGLQGLLGNYNGDATDDLIPRDSTESLASTATEQEIFENFGKTWWVLSTETLFYYDLKSYSDYQQFDWVPQFGNGDDPALLARASCAVQTRTVFVTMFSLRMNNWPTRRASPQAVSFQQPLFLITIRRQYHRRPCTSKSQSVTSRC
jgi:hypothetical protein